MAPCDVFLPACTLNVRRKSEPDFGIATRAIAEFALEASDNNAEVGATLLATLHGGKKVDNADHCDARSDNQHLEPHNIYQSPMAAYFDEFNAFNSLLTAKCKSPVPKTNRKVCFSAMVSNRYAENQNNQINNEVCSDGATSPGKVHGENDLRMVSGVDGLPYKSPLSAYFDGHESFGFGSTPKCTYTLTPISERTFSGISSDGGPTRTNSNETIMSVGSPQIPQSVQSTSSQQSQILSSTTSHGNLTQPTDDALGDAKSIRLVDEVGERKTLQLAALIGIESNETCVSMIGGSVWELSRDAKGCREVQKALSDCASSEESLAIAVQLRGHVFEAVHCPYANHVLHKIIGTLPPLCCDFIIEEFMQGGLAAVKEVATHRYGCRIMEELLRVCHSSQLNGMVEWLLFDAEALCTHMYGNFVMKSVLRCASATHRQRLLQILMDNLAYMGTNFYAGAVLAEVMQGNRVEGQTFAHIILSVSGLLSAIVKHKHGRRVLESMMTLLEDDQRRVLLKELTLPPLKVGKAVKISKQ